MTAYFLVPPSSIPFCAPDAGLFQALKKQTLNEFVYISTEKYDFEENKSLPSISGKSVGGRPLVEY
ncbi:MAG: hypothetical protein Q8N38_10220 [Bacteroidales bacterium]|nr:hypothetical protein [Bacteroidales bacterium]